MNHLAIVHKTVVNDYACSCCVHLKLLESDFQLLLLLFTKEREREREGVGGGGERELEQEANKEKERVGRKQKSCCYSAL